MPFKISLFVLLIISLFHGHVCAEQKESAPLAEKVILQLKWHHQFQFAGYYAAKHKGYFAEEGLDVEIAEYHSGLNVVDQVVSGAAQYGIGDVGVLFNYMEGAPVKALAAIFQHNPLVFISKRDSGIVSPYEMHNKRVMQELGAADNLPLMAMLADAHLDKGDYTSVAHSYNLDAFVADKVDVMSVYLSNEPYQLRALGIDVNIIKPQSYGIDFYGDLLITSKDELTNHPGRAQRFLRATLKGWGYALKHTDEIIDLIINEYSPYSYDEKLRFEAKEINKLIVPDVIPLGQLTAKRLRHVADVYERLGLIKNITDSDLKSFIVHNFRQIELSLQEQRWLQQNPHIILGVDQRFAPYEWLDEKGHHQGITADYINLLSERLQVTFDVDVRDSWNELLAATKKGEIDMLGCLVKTAEREKFLSFTQPYLNSMAVIIADHSRGYIGELTHLYGKTVAIQKGHFTEELLRNNHPQISIEITQTIEEALHAVSSGRAFAYVGDVTAASYAMKKEGILNLSFVGSTPYQSHFRMAVHKDKEILASIIQKTLASISQQERDKIYLHWQRLKVPQGVSMTIILKYVSILLCVLVFVAFWVYRLAKSENAVKRSEAHLKLILETLPDCVFKLNRYGQIIEINRAGLKMINRQNEQDVMGKYIVDCIHQEYVADFKKMLQTAIRSGKSQLEVRLNVESMETIWMEIYAVRLASPTEDDHILGVARNISPRKKNEEAQKLATLVYENSGEGMMVLDAHNHIVAINPAFTQITGYEFTDVKGRDPSILQSGIQDERFYHQLWDSVHKTGQWEGEIWNKGKDGQLYAERLIINSIFDEHNNVEMRVALFSDITESKEAEKLMWQQANFDQLTSLPNRNMFMDRLNQEIKSAHRSALSLALIYLDLDYFKEVNDSLGHEKGDLLLSEAALRLSACVRDTDTVARLGGDEFVIILPSQTEHRAVQRVAQSIIDSLTQVFTLGSDKAYVSASLGIAFYPHDGEDTASLIKCADQAMYISKQNGRGQLSFYSHVLSSKKQENSRLHHELMCALESRQLELRFQPIINISTGKVVFLEALLRWNHAKHGLLTPDRFLYIAEEYGLISQIGDWVVEESIKLTKNWQDKFAPELMTFVNRSAYEFRLQQGDDQWLSLLKKGHHVQLIIVEINEQLLLEMTNEDAQRLEAYHEAGIKISLDDFGAGYSSMTSLYSLPVDYIKIDQRYIHHLNNQTRESFLAEALIIMAGKMGIKVIAEGVENDVQKKALLRMGCELAQGYHFYNPLTVAECEEVLHRQSGYQNA